jgi:uncharacterized protein YuzE
MGVGRRRDVSRDSAREVADGVVIDVDASGVIVGMYIEDASTRIDLATLETGGLPAPRTA